MKIIFTLLSLSAVIFANEHAEQTSDIVPRTINFIIFAGLLYYLLADKIKVFFAERQQDVVSQLSKIEEKVRESKRAREAAFAQVEDAKLVASDIIETAKKEAVLLADNITKHGERDLKLLDTNLSEYKVVERNKMVRFVVTETLNETFVASDMVQNQEDLAKSLVKKVA